MRQDSTMEKKVGLLLHKFTVGHVYLFHFITVSTLLSSSNDFLVRYIDTLECSYGLVTVSKAYGWQTQTQKQQYFSIKQS